MYPCMYRRSISLPVSVHVPVQAHYLAPLKEARAVINAFINLYPKVWSVYIPGHVTLQIQDAISLLPGTSLLFDTPPLQDLPNKLHLIAGLIRQMQTCLSFTINPNLLQQEMNGHNRTRDLLNRAAESVNVALGLISTYTGTVVHWSARDILAAAIIIHQFLDNFLNTT